MIGTDGKGLSNLDPETAKALEERARQLKAIAAGEVVGADGVKRVKLKLSSLYGKFSDQ